MSQMKHFVKRSNSQYVTVTSLSFREFINTPAVLTSVSVDLIGPWL